MFGIKYSSGRIRPMNWYGGNKTIDEYLKRNDNSEIVIVPKEYINDWEIF